MECNPEMVQKHTKQLGEHEAKIEANTKDIDRHEKFYDVLMELLGEIKTQGKTLIKVVEDVDYLKDNAENKDTVGRIHERVDILERKDANEALAREKALKKWMIGGFGSILLTLATIGTLILLGLN